MTFWDSKTIYQVDDIVQYCGKLYLCLRSNKNRMPDFYDRCWKRTYLTTL